MHAAAAEPGGGVLVLGGDSGGRLLPAGDIWRLCPEPLAWHLERPPPGADPGQVPPALSGHSVTRWGHRLVVVGGFARPSVQEPLLAAVHLFDLSSRTWAHVAVGGPAPTARGNHSATLLGGSRLAVFGGETPSAQVALGDLHVLDLEAMVWLDLGQRTTGAANGAPEPAPRSSHLAAAAPGGRHMLIFGGGCNSRCFDDLWALDSETWEWWRPDCRGAAPAARAGHAGALVGAQWVVAGGGDLHRGFKDTHRLDLAGMPDVGPPEAQGAQLAWERFAGAAPQGEGMSVVACGSVLVAFGGYDGKYHNDVGLLEVDTGEEPHPLGDGPEMPAAPGQTGTRAEEGAVVAPAPADQGAVPRQAPGPALAEVAAAAVAGDAGVDRTTATPLERELAAERERAAGALRELEGCRHELQKARDENLRQEALVAELRQQLGRLQQDAAEDAVRPRSTRGLLDYITGASP